MSLRKRQSEFVQKVGLLIQKAYELGYELTFGDAYAWVNERGLGKLPFISSLEEDEYEELVSVVLGHSKKSFHPDRLAIDLNLFKDGKYLTETEDHRPLGEYWKSIGGTWGGDFKRKDCNHYSWGE